MFEKEANKYADEITKKYVFMEYSRASALGYLAGAEFGYNKAKEEIQKQDYSLFDFVMQYEDGKFKCKYKSGKEFESVDGKTWKEIVLPKEIEQNDSRRIM